LTAVCLDFENELVIADSDGYIYILDIGKHSIVHTFQKLANPIFYLK